MVSMEAVGLPTGHNSPHEIVESLKAVSDSIEQSSVADEGEGALLYLVSSCPSDETSKTLWLGKLKTAEYRLSSFPRASGRRP